MTTGDPADEHVITIAPDPVGTGLFRPDCSCGWGSGGYARGSLAEAWASEHIANVRRMPQPTTTDPTAERLLRAVEFLPRAEALLGAAGIHPADEDYATAVDALNGALVRVHEDPDRWLPPETIAQIKAPVWDQAQAAMDNAGGYYTHNPYRAEDER